VPRRLSENALALTSFVGWDSNPALDGWYVHEGVFRALADHRITLE
jgi:hypothetical protein